MPPRKKKQEAHGLEASLWEAADRLRSNMDAAEYKHVVLGLIFLKYVSDVFARRQAVLTAAVDDPESDYFMPSEAAKAAILESRDEYTAEGVFWVPEGHRWEDLRKAAKQADIGARIDAAMDAIEKENPSLKGVLPKNYARRELTPATLGGLIDTFSLMPALYSGDASSAGIHGGSCTLAVLSCSGDMASTRLSCATRHLGLP